MLTKGIRSGFRVFMAKSQYTDSITGDIICDIRIYNNKIVDFGSLRPVSRYGQTNLHTNSGKYSSTAILGKGTYTQDYAPSNKITMSKFTISFWMNILSFDSSKHWLGLSFDTDIRYHFVLINSNSQSCFMFNNIGSSSIFTSSYITTPFTARNTWNHVGITYNGSTYTMYLNGNSFLSCNYSRTPKNFVELLILPNENNILYDDIVFINNQCLWTSNFTPPNYFLTGDKKVNRLKFKQIIYPSPISRGDYFDKAFIY